jgi:hypothetical protein
MTTTVFSHSQLHPILAMCKFLDLSFYSIPIRELIRHIFDAENLNTLCQIAAHDGVLAAIRFNPEGNKLATGSEKVRENIRNRS